MITILDLLNSKEKEKLIVKHLNANEVLFKEGEKANYVGFLTSGALSIESYSLTGKLITFNTIYPGEMFGNNLVFSNDQYYLGEVKARVKSTLYLLLKEDLLNILQTNKAFLMQFLNQESEFTKSLNGKVKLLSFDSASERIMYYIHLKGDKVRINSISNLAKEVSLSREATSRTIYKLIKENKIKREGNTFSIISNI